MGIQDVDGSKLYLHPERISELTKTGRCYPLQVEIGPTNRCNNRCKFCTLDWITHGSSDIDKKIMVGALEDMAEVGVKAVYFAGEGEPLLHKDLEVFVKKASDLGMGVAISTNGTLFNEGRAKQILPYLSWMRFSVDAGAPKTYAKIHGVGENQFNNLLKNLGDAVKIKKQNNYSVDLGTQAILMPENIEEMEILVKQMKDVGVDDFQVKPCHNHPRSKHNPTLFKLSQWGLKENLEKYSTEDFKVVVRTKSMERLDGERPYTKCYGFEVFGLISAQGNVIPCNIFYDKPEFFYGNLYKQSFKEIWDGDQRKNAIDKINGDNHKFCGDYRCRLDVLNRDLNRIFNPEPNDEFI